MTLFRRRTATIEITSFGFGHGAPPVGAHLVFDVRRLFRDPHLHRRLRDLTGLDQAIVTNVMAQPGALWTVMVLAVLLRGLRRAGVSVHLAIGCVGGRHRSVVLANEIARRVGVQARHRDIAEPVLPRQTTGRADQEGHPSP